MLPTFCCASIFFYHLSDQPYEAAVLGEHVSHTIKGTGGKAALAGLLGLNGYVIASTRARGEDAAAARATDRAHAYALARYLDDKYPNDTATDTARHRLASMLLEDKQYAEAFDVLTRVRPGYAEITDVRLLEGWLATYLVNTKKDPLTDDKKAAVFKRAVADLAKVPKPTPAALEKEVRGYLSARCRLASLLFSQRTADPAAEAANPGYNQALAIATDVMAQIPGFDSMVKTAGGTKTLNVDGTEMSMLALDTYARAIYIRARALIDAADKLPPDQQAAKLAEAAAALEPDAGRGGEGWPGVQRRDEGVGRSWGIRRAGRRPEGAGRTVGVGRGPDPRGCHPGRLPPEGEAG